MQHSADGGRLMMHGMSMSFISSKTCVNGPLRLVTNNTNTSLVPYEAVKLWKLRYVIFSNSFLITLAFALGILILMNLNSFQCCIL